MIVSSCGNDRVGRIPSLLRGSVVVNVTSEDILHCIIYIIIIVLGSIFIVPPFGDVFPPIGDVINVIGHIRVEVKPLL